MLKSTTNFHELFFTQVDKIQGTNVTAFKS
jgi:hypothetical protein